MMTDIEAARREAAQMVELERLGRHRPAVCVRCMVLEERLAASEHDLAAVRMQLADLGAQLAAPGRRRLRVVGREGA